MYGGDLLVVRGFGGKTPVCHTVSLGPSEGHKNRGKGHAAFACACAMLFGAVAVPGCKLGLSNSSPVQRHWVRTGHCGRASESMVEIPVSPLRLWDEQITDDRLGQVAPAGTPGGYESGDIHPSIVGPYKLKTARPTFRNFWSRSYGARIRIIGQAGQLMAHQSIGPTEGSKIIRAMRNETPPSVGRREPSRGARHPLNGVSPSAFCRQNM